jgi:hypothetical protein
VLEGRGVNHRDRRLLDLAHRVQQCTNCERWTDHGCEPAHQNGIDAGKGFGIKSHDHRHAALCHACHAFYDQGSNGQDPSGQYNSSGVDKRDLWTRAHLKTMDYYWSQGWLKVAA